MAGGQARYHKGDMIGGRYLVHQALMGGMGEVYLCLDLQTFEPYALKTFQRRFLTDSNVSQLFNQETLTWVALEKHPHIVRCFHREILDNQPFILLEWIAANDGYGTDLRSWLQKGPLETGLALKFAIDICQGLIHAGEKQPGLVHRDLKPENILVGQENLAKVTDWGLATLVEQARLAQPSVEGTKIYENSFSHGEVRQSLLLLGNVVGTPAYMAPEQWRGEVLDARTDIYALGCILYEMLTGNRPYAGSTEQAWQSAHCFTALPALGPAFPTALGEVVGKCLSKRREERYGSAGELAEELNSIHLAEFGQSARILTTVSEFDAQDYANRGVTYSDLGYYERAIHDFDQALALEPDTAQIYNNRGAAYARHGQPERAIEDYDRALALQPDYPHVYNNRGSAYARMEQFERSIQEYDHALSLNPTLAQPYFNRGCAYFELQQYQRAIQDYNQAIALQPDYAHAYERRGAVYAGWSRYEQAVADYDQAIQLQPGNPEVYIARGAAYAAMEQYAPAIQDYTQAIALQADNTEAYGGRGSVHRRIGQYDRAIQDYDQMVRLKPGSSYAFNNRGNVYADMGQYDRAILDYDQAIGLQPDEPDNYLNKGATLIDAGQLLEALACFEEAARLGSPAGSEYAARVRAALGHVPAQEDPMQMAFAAFQQANNPNELRTAVLNFPFMTDAQFIASIARVIQQQVPRQYQAVWQQRLEWLRQIVTA